MGINSAIEWTDHTFNPWIGCTHVSPGCEHCYAETLMDQRYGRVEWGKGKPRQRTSADNWKQPLRWNKQAEREGRRFRVFCSSLADVFDPEVDQQWRFDLFDLILATSHLDWLLLTKRPHLVREMVPGDWLAPKGALKVLPYSGGFPDNIWLGTSVEDQRRADERIPHLLRVPVAVRFLSCEPLLGPLDLSGRTVDSVWIDQAYADLDPELGRVIEESGWPIHWVICGGESGAHARPMQADWARSLRDQCRSSGVAFFFKQWGEYAPRSAALNQPSGWDGMVMKHVGKKAAGRLLDGREWNELPETVTR